MTKTKPDWEKQMLVELDLLLGEYADSKDDSRIANVMEIVDNFLTDILKEIEGQLKLKEVCPNEDFDAGLSKAEEIIKKHL